MFLGLDLGTSELKALLLSDQFDVHPELLAEETARIERQQAPA